MKIHSSLICSIVMGAIMIASSSPPIGADQVYVIGPETLAAQSSTILAGPIIHYSKHILSESEPCGETIPLKWTVKGQLDRPELLKGSSVSGPISFSRQEQSIILPRDTAIPDWELEYGGLLPDGWAVMFIQGGPTGTIKVLPSGAGDRKLIRLLRNIIAIQANAKGPQPDAWLSYLADASDSGREAALRSLIGAQVQWDRLGPVLERLMADSTTTPRLRVFVFGAVACGISHEKWPDKTALAADFLCRILDREREPRLMLQYVLHIKQLLDYTDKEPFHEKRESLRLRLLQCLQQKQPHSADMRREYLEIFNRYSK